MSPAERGAFTRRLDRERRAAEARLAEWPHRVESHGLHAVDGHRSPTAWGKAECNWSGREALGFVKLGGCWPPSPLSRWPSRPAGSGAQMHALASRWQPAGTTTHLDDAIELLVGRACTLNFDEFLVALLRWESLADGVVPTIGVSGRTATASADHDRRRRVLRPGSGNVHGVQLKAILDAFAHTEWLADWEAGVAAHGDAMCLGLLERTDAQRRFDALVAIFHQAAQVAGATAAGGLVINLVMGFDRFQHHLETALGGRPAPLDLNDPMAKCARPWMGVQLDPNDVLVARDRPRAAGGDRPAGVVIDVGRKQRLFTRRCATR